MSSFFEAFEKQCLAHGLASASGNLSNMNDDIEKLESWLKNGHHAEMQWMSKNWELRKNPQLFFDGAKSYIIVAMPYNNVFFKNFSRFKISRYALLNDYHHALKNILKIILSKLSEDYPDLKYDFFVDSKPIFERSLAVKAGLGFIGKNSCLIIPQKGSWYFLGGILTNATFLTENQPIDEECGDCTKCIDACPMRAIEAPYVINANKCLSYLTIEHKGNINEVVPSGKHKNIMGCDICQAVCPHNSDATNRYHPALYNEKLAQLTDEDLEKLSSPSDFKKIFKGSPFERLGFRKLKENMENTTKPFW